MISFCGKIGVKHGKMKSVASLYHESYYNLISSTQQLMRSLRLFKRKSLDQMQYNNSPLFKFKLNIMYIIHSCVSTPHICSGMLHFKSIQLTRRVAIFSLVQKIEILYYFVQRDIWFELIVDYNGFYFL